MNGQIDIEDIKVWLGELLIENKLLQKQLIQIKEELESIKEKLKNQD